MPKFKQPLKLEIISKKLVAELFRKSLTYVENVKCGNEFTGSLIREEIGTQIDRMPGPILEIIFVEVIHKLIVEIRKGTFKGFHEALDALLRPNLKSVVLGKLLHRAKLPQKITAPCDILLPNKLMVMNNLRELDLISVCTDEILKTLARWCTSLKNLDISYSDRVTDDGLRYLCGNPTENEIVVECIGCKNIEWLGLEHLRKTTLIGISHVIENLPKLKYLRFDQIGEIFSRKFKDNIPQTSESKIPDNQKEYGLTLFDQTYNMFTPSEPLIEYVAGCCPHIRTLKVFSTDKTLPNFKSWKKVKNILLKIDGPFGPGLTIYLEAIGSNLVVIELFFETIESRFFKAIGKYCPKVRVLSLSGRDIIENLFTENENYFTAMETLKICLWSPKRVSPSFLPYFIYYSRNLRVLILNASVTSLDDSFFQSQIFAKCPISNVEELCIQGFHPGFRCFFQSGTIPLTLTTARRLLQVCPKLNKLALSSWMVLESDLKDFKDDINSSNYDMVII